MELYERIAGEMKSALKDGDTVKLSVLRMIVAEVKTQEIDKKVKSLGEEGVLQILKRHIKQHRESIEQFRSGNRPDLAEKEAKELGILEAYIPAQMDAAAVDELVKAVIRETGSATKADMGRLMKAVMEKAGGRCDGKLVSQTVMKYLK